MFQIFRARRVLTLGFACAMMLWICAIAHAKEEVEVSNSWVRATVPGQTVGAAYVTLKAKRDWNVIAVTASNVDSAEIHNMTEDKGVMKMRLVGTLALKAGKPVVLAPGGLHIMLMGLSKPLKVGDDVEVNLHMVRPDGSSHTLMVKMPVKPVEYSSEAHEKPEH